MSTQARTQRTVMAWILGAAAGSLLVGCEVYTECDTDEECMSTQACVAAICVELCGQDEHLVNGGCRACPAGTTRAAGDRPGEADTFCAPILCDENERVVDHVCVTCSAGMINGAGDVAADDDTTCEPWLCGADEFVFEHRCWPCDPGSTNEEGDDAEGPDTVCDAVVCAEDHHVDAHDCVPCPSGTSRAAGDDPAGGDTVCEASCTPSDEVCDGVDNDCNSAVDDGPPADAPVWYYDGDGDGFGDTEAQVVACEAPEDHVERGGDCDDADADTYPGAPETCADAVDLNCDGSVGFVDGDSDGYAACEDCDDSNPLANPGESEVCDGFDNNCDGDIDEGLLNTCGGCADLGDAVEGGSCDPGREWMCDGEDAVTCEVVDACAAELHTCDANAECTPTMGEEYVCDCADGYSGDGVTCFSCTDGTRNGTEEGIDCGGGCDPCPRCDDGVLNGLETDVDCGGPVCGACEWGNACEDDGDCVSELCMDLGDGMRCRVMTTMYPPPLYDLAESQFGESVAASHGRVATSAVGLVRGDGLGAGFAYRSADSVWGLERELSFVDVDMQEEVAMSEHFVFFTSDVGVHVTGGVGGAWSTNELIEIAGRKTSIDANNERLAVVSGDLHIFQLVDGSWNLEPIDAVVNDPLSVALYGNSVLLGTREELVLLRFDGSWQEVERVVLNQPVDRVAVSESGIVGAGLRTIADEPGGVATFELRDDGLAPLGPLPLPVLESVSGLGAAGTVLAVHSRGYSSGVDLFHWSRAGGWTHTRTLTGPDTDPVVERLGRGLALQSGSLAAGGAINDSDGLMVIYH